MHAYINTMQSQSHVNAINDINEKIEQQQQQDPIQSHPYGILHFLELRRSRL